MVSIDPNALKPFARKYTWWKTPDEAIATPERVIAQIMNIARTIYGTNFQPGESLKAMVYFEGGDLHTLTKEEKNSIAKATREVRDLPRVAVLDRQLAI